MEPVVKLWHIMVATEACAATLFARCGYDVSVQYGANQPEYDLMITKRERTLKVSVKGSRDGSWGLTQSFKRNVDYHTPADAWLTRHKRGTILCFVQFLGVALDQMPRVYLATPEEVVQRLKETAGGHGDTILHEEHHWGPRARGVARSSVSQSTGDSRLSGSSNSVKSRGHCRRNILTTKRRGWSTL